METTLNFYLFISQIIFVIFSLFSFFSLIVCADNCSPKFGNESGDEFLSTVKATNSSYCLMRHNRNVAQTSRPNERNSSNSSFNFCGGNEKPTDSTSLTVSSVVPGRNKMVSKIPQITIKPNWFNCQQDLSRQKSPIFNRRRASITSIPLARTIPNFGAPSQTPTSASPAHNPNDLYRYIKSDEQQQRQWNEPTQSNR